MALVINFFHGKGIFGNLYSDAGVRDTLRIRSHGFGDMFFFSDSHLPNHGYA